MQAKIREWLRILGGLKYYVLAVLLSFGGFVWSELNGHRILGDDDDTKETHSAAPGQHFYHK
jgi:hypothetical protein